MVEQAQDVQMVEQAQDVQMVEQANQGSSHRFSVPRKK
jgi:hypothetical protein